jgi:hypothetical protein
LQQFAYRYRIINAVFNQQIIFFISAGKRRKGIETRTDSIQGIFVSLL